MERTISYITISKHLISVFLGFNYSTVLEFVFALFALFAFYLSRVTGETFAYGGISTQIMLLFAIIYSGAYFVLPPSEAGWGSPLGEGTPTFFSPPLYISLVGG
jgi:hypothetical protein